MVALDEDPMQEARDERRVVGSQQAPSRMVLEQIGDSVKGKTHHWLCHQRRLPQAVRHRQDSGPSVVRSETVPLEVTVRPLLLRV